MNFRPETWLPRPCRDSVVTGWGSAVVREVGLGAWLCEERREPLLLSQQPQCLAGCKLRKTKSLRTWPPHTLGSQSLSEKGETLAPDTSEIEGEVIAAYSWSER